MSIIVAFEVGWWRLRVVYNFLTEEEQMNLSKIGRISLFNDSLAFLLYSGKSYRESLSSCLICTYRTEEQFYWQLFRGDLYAGISNEQEKYSLEKY